MSSHFTFYGQSANDQVVFVNSCCCGYQLNPLAPLVICLDVFLVGEALVRVSLLRGLFLGKRSHPLLRGVLAALRGANQLRAPQS